MTVICLKSPHLSLLALTRRADSPVKSLCAFLSSLPHLLLSPWGSIQITTALVAFEQLGGLGSAPALVSLCMARSWGWPGEGAGSDSPQAGDLGMRQPKLGFPAKKRRARSLGATSRWLCRKGTLLSPDLAARLQPAGSQCGASTSHTETPGASPPRSSACIRGWLVSTKPQGGGWPREAHFPEIMLRFQSACRQTRPNVPLPEAIKAPMTP